MRLGDILLLRILLLFPGRVVLPFIVLIRMTKSAMFPFMAWLPKAIAAPTPIRALVHSSTLVTAGIILLYKRGERFYPLLSRLGAVRFISLLLRRIRRVNEKDIKKVIALSTLSQMRFILLLMRRGFFRLALLHFSAHAFFKRLLFISAGGVISSRRREQTKRKLERGGVLRGALLQLASLSLVGAPFFTGIISKDLFVERVTPSLALLLFFLALGLTLVYTLLLVKSILPVRKKT